MAHCRAVSRDLGPSCAAYPPGKILLPPGTAGPGPLSLHQTAWSHGSRAGQCEPGTQAGKGVRQVLAPSPAIWLLPRAGQVWQQAAQTTAGLPGSGGISGWQAAGQAGRSHAGDSRAPHSCGASSSHQRWPKMLTVFLTATRRCGAGATGFSAASLAARLAKFC